MTKEITPGTKVQIDTISLTCPSTEVAVVTEIIHEDKGEQSLLNFVDLKAGKISVRVDSGNVYSGDKLRIRAW